jgi:hypothetical protein
MSQFLSRTILFLVVRVTKLRPFSQLRLVGQVYQHLPTSTVQTIILLVSVWMTKVLITAK